jgi:hypothetical protein
MAWLLMATAVVHLIYTILPPAPALHTEPAQESQA